MMNDPRGWALFRALMLKGLGHLRATLVGWTCAILAAAIIILMTTADAPLTIRFMLQAVSLMGLLAVGWCGGYTIGWFDRELEDDP